MEGKLSTDSHNHSEENNFTVFATTTNQLENSFDGDEFGDFDEFTDFGSGPSIEKGDILDFSAKNKIQLDTSCQELVQFANGFESGSTSDHGTMPLNIQDINGRVDQPNNILNLPAIDYSNSSTEAIISQFNGILDTLFPSASNIQTTSQKLDNETNLKVSNANMEVNKGLASQKKKKVLKRSDSEIGADLEKILKSIPESIEILHHLAPDQDLAPFSWKESSIRKQFYVSLGVPAEGLDERMLTQTGNNVSSSRSPSSKRSFSTPNSRSSSPQPSRKASHFRPHSASTTSLPVTQKSRRNNKSSGGFSFSSEALSKLMTQSDIDKVKLLCSISQDTLKTSSISDLKSLVTQLFDSTRQTSDALTFWLDQREKTMMDSETYNQMIECLVGHAQKIHDGDSRNGKQLQRKKNSKVANGLASLSLSFKKHKFQIGSPKSASSTSPNLSPIKKNMGSNVVPIYEPKFSL
ncbi:hypothetical protein G9A89_003054 [Geosiphon pyriformis]|nr:hypothetical protein G9A89_003054 [Geosiphon pyriformis]